MRKLRIIFMGTPEFAVPSFEMLLQNKYDVAAVVTSPDKPKGRGQQVTYSAVKESALKNGIPVLQPTSLKSPEFLEDIRSYKANLFVVVAFRMLPEQIWSIPEYGTFNLHASLLPQYRGAAPINWAVINGEKETGATTFFIEHTIDTGSILFSEAIKIHEDDTAGTLHDRLMLVGAALVIKTAKAIEEDEVSPKPQLFTDDLKKAPKIFKETCEINWDQPAQQVVNFIRGLSPYPGAWKTINNKTYKILKAEVFLNGKEGVVGSFVSDGSDLRFKTADGWVAVTELQPEGKKKMKTEEFLRGNSF